MSAETAPIIVTALFGAADFARLDELRRRHFPPQRNQVPAHLTLFHHLPPSLADELARRLAAATRSPAPKAMLSEVRSLGRGVAFRVVSDGLAAIRMQLADAFAGVLVPQDRTGWRPHVTIQNKVAPETARTLLTELKADFRPRPLKIAGLASWHYRGGPWDVLATYKFRSAE